MELKTREKIVLDLIEVFYVAGSLSLELRKKGLKKEIKSDNTPVTNGDIEVNNIITKKIAELSPSLPIISEEVAINKDIQNLKNFWLIDPIDGTKDYISGGDEFTLNAALIIDRKPVIGIINAPAKSRLFYSFGKKNSYEISNNKKIRLIKKKKDNNKIRAVHYSDKIDPEILKYHKQFNVSQSQKMKSSLKFCVVASGEFDLYVAEPRACEWDIAAGHAILEHAGGKVTNFAGKNILYGKKEFKNPSLIIKSKNIL